MAKEADTNYAGSKKETPDKATSEMTDKELEALEKEIEGALDTYEKANGPLSLDKIVSDIKQEVAGAVAYVSDSITDLFITLKYRDAADCVRAHDRFLAYLELAPKTGRPAYEKARAELGMFLAEVEKHLREDPEDEIMVRHYIRHRGVASDLDALLALADKAREESSGRIFDPAHGAVISTRPAKNAPAEPLFDPAYGAVVSIRAASDKEARARKK